MPTLVPLATGESGPTLGAMRWLKLVIGIPLLVAGLFLLYSGSATAWLLVIEPWARPNDPSLPRMTSFLGWVAGSESAEAVMLSSGQLLVGLMALSVGGVLTLGRRPATAVVPAQPSAISRISDRLARASDRLRTVSDRLARASDRLRPASDS